MKNVFYFLVFFSFCSYSQKKVLDSASFSNWPLIEGQSISNDGKYVAYSVSGNNFGKALVIESIKDSLKIKIQGAGNGQFLEDNNSVVFKKGLDSVGIIQLNNNIYKYFEHVLSYSLLTVKENQWLICQLEDELIIYNPIICTKKTYRKVYKYFSKAGCENIILQQNTNTKGVYNLLHLSLKNDVATNIGRYDNINNLTFDNAGKQFVFSASSDINSPALAYYYYYQDGKEQATCLVNPTIAGMRGMILSNKSPFFNSSGDKLFFYIQNFKDTISIKQKLISAQLNIWHHKDDSLKANSKSDPLLAVVCLNKIDSIIILSNKNDAGFGKADLSNRSDYLLMKSNVSGSITEYKWQKSAIPDLYLISTKNANRKLLRKRLMGDFIQFSRMGKYVIWYDRIQKNWYSYNISNNVEKNITHLIKEPLHIADDHPDLPRAIGIAGWFQHDSAVLIYGRYDIWKVDPDAIVQPVNITNSQGMKYHIELRCANFDKNVQDAICFNDTLLLVAFDFINKKNGFFNLILGIHPILRKLLMTDHLYYPVNQSMDAFLEGMSKPMIPVKARDSGKYLFTRMSPAEYPNLYTTTDFIKFDPLTNFSPQKLYNWYTSELIHWNLPNGFKAEGILFKPENFDPKIKYPIIFYYYEKNTAGLNAYINPQLSSGNLNIPWFVSNGYLVFVPDICYKVGYPGQSAYNAVVSAANYFSKYSWVNKTKMGLQGHSFGGFETNYIVSKTSLFRAAASAAGVSDWISLYNQTLFGKRFQWFVENRQGRMGATLWQRPDIYISNSAIFRANNITTPLLIIHNKLDQIVPINQGQELFNALTRLEKKVWLLSYNNEGHTIDEHENQLDYTIRLQQFFDHYLKDKPAPVWMTQGISDENKGIISGLELDTTNQVP
jgi:dienelactone hydrolase